MSADGTHSLTSIRGLANTLMNHPACETMGRHFIAGSGYKPRRDSLEESSVHTLRSSCQSSVSSIHSYSSPPSQRAFPRQWTSSLDTCPLFIPEVTIHFQSRPVTLWEEWFLFCRKINVNHIKHKHNHSHTFPHTYTMIYSGMKKYESTYIDTKFSNHDSNTNLSQHWRFVSKLVPSPKERVLHFGSVCLHSTFVFFAATAC